jgi:hypothetical protein
MFNRDMLDSRTGTRQDLVLEVFQTPTYPGIFPQFSWQIIAFSGRVNQITGT